MPGIDHEIHDDLLEVVGIDFDFSKIRRASEHEFDVISDDSSQQTFHCHKHGIDTNDAWKRNLSPATCQQTARQSLPARGRRGDFINEIGLPVFGFQIFAQNLRVIPNDRKNVIEVMRDSARKLADCVEFPGMQKLRFPLCQNLFFADNHEQRLSSLDVETYSKAYAIFISRIS